MRVRYSKYEPGFDDLTGADLMEMIQDFLMDSGFSDPYNRYQPDPNRTPTAEDLYDALLQALLEQGRIPEEWLREARFANRKEETRLYREIQKLIQRLQDEGYIRLSDAETADQGMQGEVQETRLELTNKSVDFLGLKSLRSLLGSLGKNAPGAHFTRHYASATGL
jgi:Ca-activated chloride channel family protein